MTSAQVRNGNLIGSAAEPFPIWPFVLVPAGGKVGIPKITDLSNAANVVQIAFHGVRLIPIR